VIRHSRRCDRAMLQSGWSGNKDNLIGSGTSHHSVRRSGTSSNVSSVVE